MSLRTRVREWLGLNEMHNSTILNSRMLHDIQEQLDNMQLALTEPINKLSTVLLDEHSTARKAASDMIGAEAIKRAGAEKKARDMTVEGNEF